MLDLGKILTIFVGSSFLHLTFHLLHSSATSVSSVTPTLLLLLATSCHHFLSLPSSSCHTIIISICLKNSIKFVLRSSSTTIVFLVQVQKVYFIFIINQDTFPKVYQTSLSCFQVPQICSTFIINHVSMVTYPRVHLNYTFQMINLSIMPIEDLTQLIINFLFFHPSEANNSVCITSNNILQMLFKKGPIIIRIVCYYTYILGYSI